MPGRRLSSRLRPQPTSDTEDFIAAFFLRDVEDAVAHAPAAADAKRGRVALRVELERGISMFTHTNKHLEPIMNAIRPLPL